MTEEKHLVLVTDDNRTIRLMIRKSLEESGFSVIEAENGAEAVKIAPQSNPDAILLDVEMPIMDGITACAELRKLKECQHTPIMMITTHEDSLSIRSAFQIGATEFTVKPINWDILGHRVTYMIRNSKDYQQLLHSQNELKEANAKIEKINIELENKISDRTKQLLRTTKELQETLTALKSTQNKLITSEKTALLSNFIEGLSRESLSPLDTAIKSLLNFKSLFQLTAKSVEQNTLKKSDMNTFIKICSKTIEDVYKNLSRLLELTKSFRQLLIDKTTESKQVININDFLNESLYSLQPALKETNLSVEITCPNDVNITSYPGILFRILMVLINNSISHGFSKNESGVININVIPENGYITLRYSDSGKGIERQYTSKVFEPFFTTKAESGSLGLGLYLLHEDVTNILGGKVAYEYIKDHGAVFIITLPSKM